MTEDTKITFPLPREVLELHWFVGKDEERPNISLIHIEKDDEKWMWNAVATNGHHLIVVSWSVAEDLPNSFFLSAEVCKQALHRARVIDLWEGDYCQQSKTITIHRNGSQYSDKTSCDLSFPLWKRVVSKTKPKGKDAVNLISFDPMKLATLGMYMKKCKIDGGTTRWSIPGDESDPLRIDFSTLEVDVIYILMPCRMEGH